MNKSFIIEKYNVLIDFYIAELQKLEQNKPFFFQHKKLQEYHQRKRYYEHKIINLYKIIESEIN